MCVPDVTEQWQFPSMFLWDLKLYFYKPSVYGVKMMWPECEGKKAHVRENLCWCGEGGKAWLWGNGKETVSLILFLWGHRENLNFPNPVPPLAVSQHLLEEGTLVWIKFVNWTWQERVTQEHRESSEDQGGCVCTADAPWTGVQTPVRSASIT